MKEHKITAQNGAKVNEQDRLALATLLVKHGYSVRIGKEKAEGKQTSTIFVGYEEVGR